MMLRHVGLENIMRIIKDLIGKVDYLDIIEYSENTIEVAYRRGSLEVNYSNPRVYALRFVRDYNWYIVSSTDPNKLTKLSTPTVRLVEFQTRKPRYKLEVDEKYIAKGKFILTGSSSIDEDKAIDLLYTLGSIVSEYSNGLADLECILVHSIIRRSITPYHTMETAYEEKSVIELYVNIVYNGGYTVVSSDFIGFLGGISDIDLSILRPRIISVIERAKSLHRAQKLGVLERGLKHNVILDSTCSAALVHEVIHFLEADSPNKVKLNTKILSDEVTIFDDPTISWGFASSAFDDECIITKPKKLVEDGLVIEYLHTVESTYDTGEGTPGNARGLFHKPKALQSNIVVKPGDWRFEEMVEEVRRGYYVEGLIRAEIDSYGNITIVPELAWVIENGELKRPVKISYLKFALPALKKSIIGLGREVRYRASYEKTHRVCEYTPPMILTNVFVA